MRSPLLMNSRLPLLFINNGDLTFTDRADEYGLNPRCASTHASFLDYDLDGDLDMYLINHPVDFANVSQMRVSDLSGKIVRTTTPDNEYTSDRLFRNDKGKFTDVSKSAGIDNYAFGLSATVMDANLDGYPDIYVANDYIVPDFLYINNKNGTFTDRINDYVRHMSHFSMGSDVADINNDGLFDLFVLDMANPTNYKDKTNSTAMRNERYYTLAQYGYGEQMMRNVLQLNNGNGTFSEIGCLAGVSATDWSWSPLMIDFDNDGWRDIYISNGFRAEVQNLDFVTFEIDST
ncbi:MAG: FG-GAP repeat domain-containing protein, partial [Bacteroidota bacterium]